MLQSTMTWEDFAVHRTAATPLQWRRMVALFSEGKTPAGVLSEEAPPASNAGRRTATALSIGRGCTAVFNSMLQRPVPVPHKTARITHVEPAAAQSRAKRRPPTGTSAKRKPRKRQTTKRTQPSKRWMLAVNEPDSGAADTIAGIASEPEGALAFALRAALVRRARERPTVQTGMPGTQPDKDTAVTFDGDRAELTERK
jgi:hypothetical protein